MCQGQGTCNVHSGVIKRPAIALGVAPPASKKTNREKLVIVPNGARRILNIGWWPPGAKKSKKEKKWTETKERRLRQHHQSISSRETPLPPPHRARTMTTRPHTTLYVTYEALPRINYIKIKHLNCLGDHIARCIAAACNHAPITAALLGLIGSHRTVGTMTVFLSVYICIQYKPRRTAAAIFIAPTSVASHAGPLGPIGAILTGEPAFEQASFF